MKYKLIIILFIGLIAVSSLSAVSASMSIKGGSFSTGSELSDLTYARIYVGEEHAGENVILQIWYSRDGSTLNNGNMVPVTVHSDGFLEVQSADAYAYFPDHAEIKLYDRSSNLLDTESVTLSPESGKQTFGIGNFDDSSSYSSSSSSSGSSFNSASGTTSNSYVGNTATGKFHAPGCGDVAKMDEANKVYFSSRDEATGSGYSPCGHCHP